MKRRTLGPPLDVRAAWAGYHPDDAGENIYPAACAATDSVAAFTAVLWNTRLARMAAVGVDGLLRNPRPRCAYSMGWWNSAVNVIAVAAPAGYDAHQDTPYWLLWHRDHELAYRQSVLKASAAADTYARCRVEQLHAMQPAQVRTPGDLALRRLSRLPTEVLLLIAFHEICAGAQARAMPWLDVQLDCQDAPIGPGRQWRSDGKFGYMLHPRTHTNSGLL